MPLLQAACILRGTSPTKKRSRSPDRSLSQSSLLNNQSPRKGATEDSATQASMLNTQLGDIASPPYTQQSPMTQSLGLPPQGQPYSFLPRCPSPRVSTPQHSESAGIYCSPTRSAPLRRASGRLQPNLSEHAMPPLARRALSLGQAASSLNAQLTEIEEECLLRLGTKPNLMRHASPVSCRQQFGQLPASLTHDLPPQPRSQPPKSRDPRSMSPANRHSGPVLNPNSADGSHQGVKAAQSSQPPMSPTQSAMVATLMIPESSPESLNSAFNAPKMLPSPFSGMSNLCQLSPVSQSPLPPLDALLHDYADPALGAFDFDVDDSDFLMLNETIQAAAQQAQHDSLSSPQASRLDPVSQRAFAANAPPLTPTLLSHVSQGIGVMPDGRSRDKPLLKWPEFPPYTICRWQVVVMQ